MECKEKELISKSCAEFTQHFSDFVNYVGILS